ncbi:MAG: hypothetical protein P8Y71_13860 [Pseudolabrys sp.]
MLLSSAASVALAAALIQWLAGGGSMLVLGILIVVCLINALGLLRLTAWARVSTTVVLWLVIISLLGRFTPMYSAQYVDHGQVPPSLPYLILSTVVIAIPCLAAIVIFRKHREQFRRAWF